MLVLTFFNVLLLDQFEERTHLLEVNLVKQRGSLSFDLMTHKEIKDLPHRGVDQEMKSVTQTERFRHVLVLLRWSPSQLCRG
jgi:hypothetical protein